MPLPVRFTKTLLLATALSPCLISAEAMAARHGFSSQPTVEIHLEALRPLKQEMARARAEVGAQRINETAFADPIEPTTSILSAPEPIASTPIAPPIVEEATPDAESIKEMTAEAETPIIEAEPVIIADTPKSLSSPEIPPAKEPASPVLISESTDIQTPTTLSSPPETETPALTSTLAPAPTSLGWTNSPQTTYATSPARDDSLPWDGVVEETTMDEPANPMTEEKAEVAEIAEEEAYIPPGQFASLSAESDTPQPVKLSSDPVVEKYSFAEETAVLPPEEKRESLTFSTEKPDTMSPEAPQTLSLLKEKPVPEPLESETQISNLSSPAIAETPQKPIILLDDSQAKPKQNTPLVEVIKPAKSKPAPEKETAATISVEEEKKSIAKNTKPAAPQLLGQISDKTPLADTAAVEVYVAEPKPLATEKQLPPATIDDEALAAIPAQPSPEPAKSAKKPPKLFSTLNELLETQAPKSAATPQPKAEPDAPKDTDETASKAKTVPSELTAASVTTPNLPPIPPAPPAPALAKLAPAAGGEVSLLPPPPPEELAMATKKGETKTASLKAPAAAMPISPNASGLSSRLLFDGKQTKLSDAMHKELDRIAATLQQNQSLRISLVAHAADSQEQTSMARRVSLARALSVRAYLIDQGVDNLRINVQAEGSKNPADAPNRVDLFLLQPSSGGAARG